MDREAIDKAVQVRTMKERLVEIANRSEPVLEETGNLTEAELAAETGKWENEKSRVEQSLADLKGRLEEAKEDYGATDVEFHAASIEIERSRNRLKKNEDEALQKEAALDSFERERVRQERKGSSGRKGPGPGDRKAGRVWKRAMRRLQEGCRTAVARYEETKTRLGDLHMEKVAIQEELQSLDQEIEKIRVRKEALEKEKARHYREDRGHSGETSKRLRGRKHRRRARSRPSATKPSGRRSSGSSRPWARSTSGQKRNRSS